MRQGAVYELDDTILTKLKKQGNGCSYSQWIIVCDHWGYDRANASGFKVERTTNGKMTVSVNPFLF